MFSSSAAAAALVAASTDFGVTLGRPTIFVVVVTTFVVVIVVVRPSSSVCVVVASLGDDAGDDCIKLISDLAGRLLVLLTRATSAVGGGDACVPIDGVAVDAAAVFRRPDVPSSHNVVGESIRVNVIRERGGFGRDATFVRGSAVGEMRSVAAVVDGGRSGVCFCLVSASEDVAGSSIALFFFGVSVGCWTEPRPQWRSCS